MTQRFFSLLEDRMDDFSVADHAIATFLLHNRGEIPFETAASIARKLQVSPVTVGRFCRKLGYRHFNDIRDELKADISKNPWLVGDQLSDFIEQSGDHGRLRRSLELEIAGLAEAYSTAETALWQSIVELLAQSESVTIAGFQTERGLAAMLAYQLQYVRPGVMLADIGNGNFAEVLLARTDSQCVVIFETRRYSRQAYLLCQQAKEANIPVIFITDKYCDWARRFTPYVIGVATECEMFWSSSVAFSCIVNLLVNGVIGNLGGKVEERLAKYTELYQIFVGHTGPGGTRERKAGGDGAALPRAKASGRKQ